MCISALGLCIYVQKWLRYWCVNTSVDESDLSFETLVGHLTRETPAPLSSTFQWSYLSVSTSIIHAKLGDLCHFWVAATCSLGLVELHSAYVIMSSIDVLMWVLAYISDYEQQLPYMVTQARSCKLGLEQHETDSDTPLLCNAVLSFILSSLSGCIYVHFSPWTLCLCVKTTEILMFQYQPWWLWHEFCWILFDI